HSLLRSDELLGNGRRIRLQVGDRFTIGRKGADAASPVRRDEAVGIQDGTQGDVTEWLGDGNERLAGLIPNLGDLVATARDEAAIRGEINPLHAAIVSAPAFHFLALFHFPEADLPVGARTREETGHEGKRSDRRFVAGESLVLL